MEDLRAIAAGKGLPVKFAHIEVPEETEAKCTYREWDGEAGEWFGCRLNVHSPKVKHVRGEKL